MASNFWDNDPVTENAGPFWAKDPVEGTAQQGQPVPEGGGIDAFQGRLGGIAATFGRLSGSETLEQYGEGVKARNLPKVTSFEGILGDPGTFAAETGGEVAADVLGQSAATATGAAIGGAIGSLGLGVGAAPGAVIGGAIGRYGYSFLTSYDSIKQEQKKMGNESEVRAIVGAAIAAGFDFFGPVSKTSGKIGEAITAKGRERVLKELSSADPATLATYGMRIGKGAGVEGGTEFIQEMVENQAAAGLHMPTGKELSEQAFAGVKGALGGAGVTGVEQVQQARFDKKLEETVKEENRNDIETRARAKARAPKVLSDVDAANELALSLERTKLEREKLALERERLIDARAMREEEAAAARTESSDARILNRPQTPQLALEYKPEAPNTRPPPTQVMPVKVPDESQGMTATRVPPGSPAERPGEIVDTVPETQVFPDEEKVLVSGPLNLSIAKPNKVDSPARLTGKNAGRVAEHFGLKPVPNKPGFFEVPNQRIQEVREFITPGKKLDTSTVDQARQEQAANQSLQDFGEQATPNTDFDDLPVFSRGDDDFRGTGMSEQQVTESVNKVLSNYSIKPDVVVFNGLNDERVPEAVRSEAAGRKASNPAAFKYKGKVYINTSRMASEQDVKRAFAHEGIGHLGVELYLGKGNIRKTYAAIAKKASIEVKKYVRQYKLENEPDGDVRGAMEYVAHLAQTNPQNSLVRRVVFAIKQQLRKIGYIDKRLKLSDNDIIQQYIIPARKLMESGSRNPKFEGMTGDHLKARVAAKELENSFVPDKQLRKDIKETQDELNSREAVKEQLKGENSELAQFDIKSREFLSWFKGSKIVDSDGTPKVMYHGSIAELWEDGGFKVPAHFGTKEQANNRVPRITQGGRRTITPNSKVFPVYLNIRNPKRVRDVPENYPGGHVTYWNRQMEKAIEEGHDGLVYANEYESDARYQHDSVVAFYPEQIRSAMDPDVAFMKDDKAAAELQQNVDKIKTMPQEKYDNTNFWDMPGGTKAHNLFEAQKLLPKPSEKLKRVSDSNTMSLWQEYYYIANVDGEYFGVTKYEDPDNVEGDDESNDKYVFAYQSLNDPNAPVVETTIGTSDVPELMSELRKHQKNRGEPAQFMKDPEDANNPDQEEMDQQDEKDKWMGKEKVREYRDPFDGAIPVKKNKDKKSFNASLVNKKESKMTDEELDRAYGWPEKPSFMLDGDTAPEDSQEAANEAGNIILRTGKAIWNLFESSTQTLRKNDHTRALGDAIQNLTDYYKANRGVFNEQLDPLLKMLDGFGRKKTQELENALTEYYSLRQSGKTDEAAAMLDSNPDLAKGVKAIDNALSSFYEVLKKANVKVFDPTTDSYREIGKVPNYFPNILKPEFRDALRNPYNRDGKTFNSDFLKFADYLIAGDYQYQDDDGKTVKVESVEDALHYVQYAQKTDDPFTGFFGNVERGRTTPFPEEVYDRSLSALIKYRDFASERVAQIQAFGQHIPAANKYKKGEPQQKELFEATLEKIPKGDVDTILLVSRLQRIIYGDQYPSGNVTQVAGILNTAATGTQLSGPESVLKNFLGGEVNSFFLGSLSSNLASYRELMSKEGRAAARDLATALGITQDDYLRAILDLDLQSFSQYKGMEKAKRVTSDFTGELMSLRRFGPLKHISWTKAEAAVRVRAMMVGKYQLNEWKRAYEQNPKSQKAKVFQRFANEQGINLSELMNEEGVNNIKESPQTARFLRRFVDETQGSYRQDQQPWFMDHPLGRFFLKYSKFSVRQFGLFNDYVLKNLNSKDPDLRKEGVKNLVGFFSVYGTGGYTTAWATSQIFGNAFIPSVTEILNVLGDDEDKWNKFRYLASVTYDIYDQMAAWGPFGIAYQKWNAVNNFGESPLNAPGLAAISDFLSRAWDFARTTKYQDPTTVMKEVRDWLIQNFSLGHQFVKAAANLSDGEVFSLFDAKRTVAASRRASERFLRETTGGKVAKSFGPAESPFSPVQRKIYEALLQGKAEEAKEIYQKALEGAETGREKESLSKSIPSSMKARRPMDVKGTPSGAAGIKMFDDWAKTHLPEDDYKKIKALDDLYMKSLKEAGLGKPYTVAESNRAVREFKKSLEPLRK